MRMRRILLILLFLISGMAGFVAGALTPNTVASPTLSYKFASPGPSSTSLAYGLGYQVTISVNNGGNQTVAALNASLGAGPSVGSVSTAYGVGYGLGIDSYTVTSVGAGEPAQVVQPPPGTVTVTNTTTMTMTKTYTVTRTITGANGEKTVITQVRTVTIPEQRKVNEKYLLGAGVLALLFLLVIARR